MRIAGVRADGNVWPLLGNDSSAVKLLEYPDLQIIFRERLFLANVLRGGRHLVIEPWLERLLDFSAQLEMAPDGLKLCGYTGLLNDAKGRFQGNWAESHHHKRIPSKIVALFRELPDISTRLLDFYGDLFARLEEELRRVHD